VPGGGERSTRGVLAETASRWRRGRRGGQRFAGVWVLTHDAPPSSRARRSSGGRWHGRPCGGWTGCMHHLPLFICRATLGAVGSRENRVWLLNPRLRRPKNQRNLHISPRPPCATMQARRPRARPAADLPPGRLQYAPLVRCPRRVRATARAAPRFPPRAAPRAAMDFGAPPSEPRRREDVDHQREPCPHRIIDGALPSCLASSRPFFLFSPASVSAAQPRRALVAHGSCCRCGGVSLRRAVRVLRAAMLTRRAVLCCALYRCRRRVQHGRHWRLIVAQRQGCAEFPPRRAAARRCRRRQAARAALGGRLCGLGLFLGGAAERAFRPGCHG
jgi:hypothetical protein